MSKGLICAIITEVEKNVDKVIASKGDKPSVAIITNQVIPKIPNTNHKKTLTKEKYV